MRRNYGLDEKANMDTKMATLKSDIETIATAYDQWKASYATLLDNITTGVVTGFYEDVIGFLETAKTDMNTVYEEGYEAAEELSEVVDVSKDLTDILTAQLNAYTQMITSTPAVFTLDNDDFHEKLSNATADIRQELVEKMYVLYFKDGGWEDILEKKAKKISIEEYIVLAKIYTELSGEELLDFINALYEYNTEYDNHELSDAFLNTPLIGPNGMIMPSTGPTFDQDACTNYVLNQDKLLNILQYVNGFVDMNYIQLEYLDQEGICSGQMIDERERLIQHCAILEALSHVPSINSNEDHANLQIDYMDNGTVEIHYLSSGILDNTYAHHTERTITISAALTGNAGDQYFNKTIENMVVTKYGLPEDVLDKTIRESIIGTAIGLATDKTIDYITEGIPVVGDIVMIPVDFIMDYDANLQDAQLGQRIIQLNDFRTYTNFFELTNVYIDYSDDEISNVFMMNPGLETEDVIQKFNEGTNSDEKLELYDVLNNVSSTEERIEELYISDSKLYNSICN